MPKKIPRPAYFKLCGKNNEFGKIIFSDGTGSKFITTKFNSLEELAKYFNNGRITKKDADTVAKQINESSLPMHDDEEKVIIVYTNAVSIHEAPFKSKKRWIQNKHFSEEDSNERSFSE